METYLHLMYLKHRHGLGYETLGKEVADSLSWRRFCRIHLDRSVPQPTTLMTLTRRFGPAIVEDFNAAVLEEAVEKKVPRTRRLRVDTNAMEADVRYPTDSGLCAHVVSRMTRAVKAVKRAGSLWGRGSSPALGSRRPARLSATSPMLQTRTAESLPTSLETLYCSATTGGPRWTISSWDRVTLFPFRQASLCGKATDSQHTGIGPLRTVSGRRALPPPGRRRPWRMPAR
jgi:hypothetical protein